MGAKISYVKQSATGEQLVYDLLQCNPVTGEKDFDSVEDMNKALEELIHYGELRVHEMNLRAIEAVGLRKLCNPEEWSKLVDMLDFLAGRQSLDLIHSRWQAKIEENAELEAERAKALKELDSLPEVEFEEASFPLFGNPS